MADKRLLQLTANSAPTTGAAMYVVDNNISYQSTINSVGQSIITGFSLINQNSFNTLSGNLTTSGSNLLTIINNESGAFNLTGSNLNNKINSLSGYINSLNVVYTTGNQSITGIKKFTNISPNYISGSGIILDIDGGKSIDWNNRILIYPNNNMTAVDWYNDKIFDGDGNISLSWSAGLRFLYDNSNSNSLDWNDRLLYDVNSNISAEWGNRVLYDISYNPVLDWQNKALNDTNDGQSANWNDRLLYDSNGYISTDWNNRVLYNSSALVTIDWGFANLYDILGGASLGWQTRELYDGLTNISADWNNRFLYDSNGGLAINWDSRILSGNWTTTNLVTTGATILKNIVYTTGNQSITGTKIFKNISPNYISGSGVCLGVDAKKSIDWNNRILIDTNGNTFVDWNNSELLDGYGKICLNWSARTLGDISNNTSIDWGLRTLYNSNNSVSVDWDNGYLKDANDTLAARWTTRLLYHPNFSYTLDWWSQILYDSGQNLSLDWVNRQLKKNDGSTLSLDWQNLALNGNWTANNNLTITGYSSSHIFMGAGSTPQIIAGIGLGTGIGASGAFLDSNAKDSRMLVTLTGGASSVANNPIFSVKFNQTLENAPYVFCEPANLNTTTLNTGLYVLSQATTGFVFASSSPLTSGTVYKMNIWVVE